MVSVSVQELTLKGSDDNSSKGETHVRYTTSRFRWCMVATKLEAVPVQLT